MRLVDRQAGSTKDSRRARWRSSSWTFVRPSRTSCNFLRMGIGPYDRLHAEKKPASSVSAERQACICYRSGLTILLLVSHLPKPFLPLVRRHFMAFALLTARHEPSKDWCEKWTGDYCPEFRCSFFGLIRDRTLLHYFLLFQSFPLKSPSTSLIRQWNSAGSDPEYW